MASAGDVYAVKVRGGCVVVRALCHHAIFGWYVCVFQGLHRLTKVRKETPSDGCVAKIWFLLDVMERRKLATRIAHRELLPEEMGWPHFREGIREMSRNPRDWHVIIDEHGKRVRGDRYKGDVMSLPTMMMANAEALRALALGEDMGC